MNEKELKLIEGLLYSIAYTLDAIRPLPNVTTDTRIQESKDKAERELSKCMELLKDLKKS